MSFAEQLRDYNEKRFFSVKNIFYCWIYSEGEVGAMINLNDHREMVDLGVASNSVRYVRVVVFEDGHSCAHIVEPMPSAPGNTFAVNAV